jgi:hypothetical protein
VLDLLGIALDWPLPVLGYPVCRQNRSYSKGCSAGLPEAWLQQLEGLVVLVPVARLHLLQRPVVLVPEAWLQQLEGLVVLVPVARLHLLQRPVVWLPEARLHLLQRLVVLLPVAREQERVLAQKTALQILLTSGQKLVTKPD